jgi:hypothetical protein
MRTTTYAGRVRPRPLVVSAVVAATLGFGADQAAADYTAAVDNGTLTLRGNAADDTLVLHTRAGEPAVLEADVGGDGVIEFTFDRSTFTAVDVLAGGGDDVVRVANGFTDELTSLDGGTGDDTLIGGLGDQMLIGGSGNDAVAGGDGNDTARLGSGADRFSWNPGDDGDVVDGEDGDDVLDFNGSSANETYDIAPAGARVRLLRDVANVTMDLGAIETIDLDVFGGTDTIVGADAAGTALTSVDLDLSAVNGLGDGQADSVIVGATSADDDIGVSTPGGAVAVSGLAAAVRVSGGEAHDEVNVGTGEGDDTITTSVETTGAALVDVDGGPGDDAAAYLGSAAADQIGVVSNGAKLRTGGTASLPFDTIVEDIRVLALGGDDSLFAVGNTSSSRLTFDGGTGADDVRGGVGPDRLLGGAGDDLLDGNQGADVAELGGGGDRFTWDPGDGSDTVEGEGGSDAVHFNGSNAGESIELSADGGRARLTRTIANITMDADEVEAFAVRALGGADTFTVNDLAGTDVEAAGVDLGADGVADTAVVNGTGGDDAVRISRSGGQAKISGLAAETRVGGSEAALDVLRVDTRAGDDEVTIASNLSDLIGLAVDLGADD